ncbi:MAG TPA: hypothetical protein VL986_11255 [Terracidiphilus sp.]|nr:hypothetical protein [Terracidiphilus sp.]
MRRGLSIFLILLFGLGPLSSLIDGSEESNLPACCRRHGAHHCAMSVQVAARMRATESAESEKSPTLSSPSTCSQYPGAIALLFTPLQALLAAAVNVQAPHTFVFVSAAMQPSPLATPARAHSGRGPPATNPA